MSKVTIKSKSKKYVTHLCPPGRYYRNSPRRRMKCSFPYRAYGFTSDPGPSAMVCQVDPYEEMERKLQRINNVKAMEISLSSLSLRRRRDLHGGGGGDDTSTQCHPPGTRSFQPEGGETSQGVPGNVIELEDDEEEGVVSQDAKLNGDNDITKMKRNLLRDLQISLMENVCKNVEPRDLLDHFHRQGYFNHSYDSHARTSQKTGSKSCSRDINFLYSMLGRSTAIITTDGSGRSRLGIGAKSGHGDD